MSWRSHVVFVVAFLLSASPVRSAGPKRDPQVHKELEESLRADSATTARDAVDSQEVLLSPHYYRAIQSVERYRNHRVILPRPYSTSNISQQQLNTITEIVPGGQPAPTGEPAAPVK